MSKNVTIIGVLVLIVATFIVGDGSFRAANSLDKLNSGTLRGITGAEGLSIAPESSVSVLDSASLGNVFGRTWTGSTNLKKETSSMESNQTKIKLTGNSSGIQTNHLLGSGASNQPGINDINSAGPFSLNLTIVPGIYNGRPNGSDLSIRMPELSGSVGGDFMINSHQRRFSAGRISIGNLQTPAKVNLSTNL